MGSGAVFIKQKVDRDEFAVLEKRVSLLEAKLNQ